MAWSFETLFAIAELLRTLPEEERAVIRLLVDPPEKLEAIIALLRALPKEDLEEVLRLTPTQETYRCVT